MILNYVRLLFLLFYFADFLVLPNVTAPFLTILQHDSVNYNLLIILIYQSVP